MKKMMALMLAFIMVTTCMISTAFAAEPTPEVSVSFEASAIIADSDVIDAGNRNESLPIRASSSDYDLGSDGSLGMTIKNFKAGTIRQSDYNYKTNSTKIKISMKSDISVSVKVKLYDAATNSLLQETTKTVGTVLDTTVTFSNLTSAKKYFIKYENLDQQDVDISGTISA